MALSEENEVKIAKILGKSPLNISDQIAYVNTRLTAVVQTAIEDEIARWDTKGFKFTKIEGGEFAAFIDPEREKNDIRNNIANLLERPDWARSGSGITSRVQRG